MQPYRRTDTRGPAPVHVRGPGSAAPDRVRAWAFAPGCGPCRASTRTTRRAAGKRTPAAARARPSADGWARSGSWERRGLGPDSCGRGLDAAGSSWAAPGAGRPRRWWRRPRDPPPGPRRPDVYQGHEADHATRGATSRRRRKPRPGHGPGRDQPQARAPASRRPGGTGRTAGQSGPGRARARGRPRPGQTGAGAIPCHAHDAG